MIKYQIFKIAMRVAQWSCMSGFAFDYLEEASRMESNWASVYLWPEKE